MKPESPYSPDTCYLEKYILDNANLAVWAYDTELRYTYFNSVYHENKIKLTGVAPEIGDSVVSGYPEELKKNWLPLFKKALDGQWFEEELIITEKPELFCTLSQFNPIKDDQGNTIGAYIFSRNITSKIKAEHRIKKSEEFLKQLIDILPIPIYAKNKELEYILANKAFAKAANKPVDAILGAKVDDIWESDFAAKMNVQDIEVFEVGHSSSLEILYDEKGNKRTTIVLKNTLPDYEGNVILIGAILDITEQKNVEEALNYEKSILRDLIDSVPDLIFFKNYDGYYIGCNKAFEKFCGHAEEWLIGHSDYDMFPKIEADEFRRMDKKTMDSGEQIKFEEEVAYPDGTKVLLETIKVPIMLNNESGGIIGISRDITDRKKAETSIIESEKALRKANSFKDKLFSVIAHDLKNPYTAMLNLTTILNANYHKLSDEKRIDYIQKILNAAKTNFSLLNNLLNWAISQMDHEHLEPVDINLKYMVTEILKTLDASLGHKRLQVKIDIASDLKLTIDGNSLRTILQNLISNSIKFTHDGGSIEISAERTTSEVIISVSDTGIGMSEEKRDSLFQVNLSKSTPGTHNESGSGLGLLLCKEYVEKNNGTIEVESTLGKGSTFIVRFPV